MGNENSPMLSDNWGEVSW